MLQNILNSSIYSFPKIGKGTKTYFKFRQMFLRVPASTILLSNNLLKSEKVEQTYNHDALSR
jgi:hypothetical protein